MPAEETPSEPASEPYQGTMTRLEALLIEIQGEGPPRAAETSQLGPIRVGLQELADEAAARLALKASRSRSVGAGATESDPVEEQ